MLMTEGSRDLEWLPIVTNIIKISALKWTIVISLDIKQLSTVSLNISYSRGISVISSCRAWIRSGIWWFKCLNGSLAEIYSKCWDRYDVGRRSIVSPLRLRIPHIFLLLLKWKFLGCSILSLSNPVRWGNFYESKFLTSTLLSNNGNVLHHLVA